MQCAVLSYTVCSAVQYFSTSHRRYDYQEKEVNEHEMCVLILSKTSLCNIFHSYERDRIKNVYLSSCKVHIIRVRF